MSTEKVNSPEARVKDYGEIYFPCLLPFISKNEELRSLKIWLRIKEENNGVTNKASLKE